MRRGKRQRRSTKGKRQRERDRGKETEGKRQSVETKDQDTVKDKGGEKRGGT
jgi:hypothetical protein